MDGLECCEVMLSYIKSKTYDFRMESEFYRKNDIEELNKIEFNSVMLENGLIEFVSDGTHFTPNYVENGVPFLSALNVKRGYLDVEAGYQHITLEEHKNLCKRVRPQEGDILLRKVGVGERMACVVPKLNFEFSIFVSVALIRAKINPYYLSTFINTKYGQLQLLRFNKGISQPDLHLEDIQRLLVPLFSDKFYIKINDVMIEAQEDRNKANNLYSSACALLQKELGLESFTPSTQNTAEKNLSEVFKTGRLDAEYFMPKYETYYEAVANYKNGHASIGSMFEQIDSKCSREKLSYKYIEIGDVNVGTGVASFNVIETNELPDNAKIMTKKDDILISKVRPNRGAIAILEDDDFLVSGAFTVLREKNKYKKEVLHVILRSEIYRDWLLRYNVGTSYPVIKDEDVLNMPLPMLDEAKQNEIAARVQESFKLRNESEKLINTAVRAVEIAIEQSEEKAMEFINNYKNRVSGSLKNGL